MKWILYSVFSVFSFLTWAQNDSLLIQREQELAVLLTQLRNSKDNAEKESNNAKFVSYLKETIEADKAAAFSYSFSKLKTVGSIKSPDNTFRLFNWNVEQDDRSNKYYCFILRYEEKKKEWRLIELKDNSANLPPRTEEILDEKNWMGALYYKIIPVAKSNKTVYTVLGWDGNTSTNSKLIEVISFNGTKVKFGAPIFKLADGTHKRLYFEHSKKAFMSLNFDEARQRIIYDHLSPETPSLEGFYEYYVPDFSYDQLVYKNNKWTIEEDVVGVNEKSNSDYTLNYLNKKTGEVVSDKEKNKWVDPTDKNAPGGANTHTASLPSDAKSNQATNSSTNTPAKKVKVSKRNKRNQPDSYNPAYYGGGRGKKKG
jgi:hypothetical protein